MCDLSSTSYVADILQNSCDSVEYEVCELPEEIGT